MWDTKNDCPVIAGFTLLAPKCYFIYDEKGNIIKKGFKGIRIKSEKSDYCDKLIGENTLKLFGFEPVLKEATENKPAHWDIKGNEKLRKDDPESYEKMMFNMWTHGCDNNLSMSSQENVHKFIKMQLDCKPAFILSS